jgi:hypothetical protein
MLDLIINTDKSFYSEKAQAQVKLKQAKQAKEHQESYPARLAKREEMFLNHYLAINTSQEKLLKKLRLTPEQYILVIHLLSCHRIQDNKREDAGANYIPVSADFFSKFKLHAAWKKLQELGIVEVKDYVNRGARGQGRCRRFRIVPELMAKFTAAGLKNIRAAKKAIEVLVRGYVPLLQKSDRCLLIKYMLPQMLRINIDSLRKSIEKEVAAAKQAPMEQRAHLLASVAQAVNCLWQIQVQLVKQEGWPDHIRGYNPIYIQTATQLRSYETQGGFQGLPARHKRAALEGTGQTMCDFERAHMQIAHVLCINILKIASPLQQIVEGDYPEIKGLPRAAVKKIASAAVNGAKGTNLKADKGNLAIVKICREHTKSTEQNKIQKILNEVQRVFKPIVIAMKQLTKHFKAKGQDYGRATMSVQYQTYEQEAVRTAAAKAQGGMVANEHDGWVEQEEQGRQDGNINPLLNINSTYLQGLTFKIKRESFPC